jgi:rod shape-determining protein MreC
VLRASTRKPYELNWLDRLVLRVSSPVEELFTGAAHGVGRAWSGYINLVETRRDNLRLENENRRLQGEVARARLEEERVKRLESLLQLRAEVPSETIAARVVGVETSPHFRVVRIRLDRGAGEVKPGMVVLVPEGVVGRISRVFGPYCDVLLAVDPESQIDVRVPRTGARGVLKGKLGDNVYRTHIPEMARGEEAAVGDEVVTSGIGGFPREIPVGKVVRVTKPDSGLWQDVEVSPSVDFARLGEVLVVLAPPPPPDPEGPHKVPEPKRGLMAPR